MNTRSLTVGRWLKLWLASFPEGELGYGLTRRLYFILANELGDFGKLPLDSVGIAEVFRFVETLPKRERKLAYAFMQSGLRAARNAGLANKYPGLPAKRMVIGWVWMAVRTLVLFGVAVGLVTTAAAADRMIRFKEEPLTAYATVVRQAGFGVVVAFAEDIYYSYINLPTVGGNPTDSAKFDDEIVDSNVDRAEPASVAFVELWGPAGVPSEPPARLVSPVAPKPGEGNFLNTRIFVNGSSAIRIARIRPDTEHTSYFATITWLDSSLLAFKQIPGTEVPEGKYDRGDGLVPKELRAFYVAGLNNAFLMRDSQGGFVYEGKVVKKLVDGKATLVTYQDGTLDVLKWGRDLPTKEIQAARQNLTLMVDDSLSQVEDESQSKWGWVWEGVGSGKNLVWRSAIGVRADGTIVYCIGPVLSARSLADMMVRAGAVRAMPLDMNSAYANGFLYGPYAPGKRIDPNIYREPDRFFVPSERDFIAVFAKSP
ncbi:MAG: hypothetical protein RL510_1111 [Actinomycetota bacterium]